MTATSGLLILLVVSVAVLSLCVISVGKFSLVEAYENVEPFEASDRVSRLPELFSDEKLPVRRDNNDQCYPHVGCIRRIRSQFSPMDPLEMSAAFHLATQSSQVKVRYNMTSNCLEDHAHRCRVYPFDLSLIEKSSFNPAHRTIILVAGWNSGEPNEFLQQVKQQWLTMNEPVNIIEAYWSGGSKSSYMKSVPSTKVFARQLAVFIYYLGQMKGSYQLTDSSFTGKFNFVGHSLGAHISSFAAKDLNGQVGLITALDPALPWFNNAEPDFMLHRKDAKLVQVLHTNGALYGQMDPIGDLDFYANDGMYQPGCNIDNVLGCSHNRATTLYIQFLQNEVYLKHFLASMDKKYHINHRLFSYRGESFGRFQNGSALMDNCRSLAFVKYVNQTCIKQCIVPMDFVTDAERQLKDLKIRYNIDVAAEKSHKSNQRLYFYTAKKTPYLNNHHLLKVKAFKSASIPDRCDVIMNLQMSGGATEELLIKDYEFMSQGGYLEVAVPFLSMNMKSKYELAGLDAQQFYQTNMTKLQESLLHIFPKAIRVKAYLVGESKSMNSWSNSLLNLLGFGQKPDAVTGCDLNIISISIQPMKKLTRTLIAYYDTDAKLKSLPDLTFMLENNTANLDSEYPETLHGTEFYMSDALIGPFEDDTHEEADDSKQVLKQEQIEPVTPLMVIDAEPETSSVSKTIWVMLTMLSISLIVAFVYWHLTIKPLATDQIPLTGSEA